MAISPDQVPARLKPGCPPLALVAGEEPLLLQEAADQIRAAARAAGHEERTVFDAERGFNWQQVVDAGNSLSLFASRRLIEVRVNGALGEEGGAVLKRLSAQPLPDCCLLVTLGPLDARARKSAWYTQCERHAFVVYAWPVKAAEWSAWVAERCRRAGLNLTPAALQLLAERTEGNLLACAQDIAKLGLLNLPPPIDDTALAEAVADNARFGVFDLSDRLLAGDAAGAARSLSRLREEGVALQEVLGGLLWTLRGLARAAPAYARSRDLAGACDLAGIPRARQSGYGAALRRIHPAQPLGWLRDALAIDRRAKSTGGEPGAWADLLTLVLAASGAALLRPMPPR